MKPDRDLPRLRGRARRRLRRGDAAGAIEPLRRALTLAPDDAEGHALLSIALSHADRQRAAAVEAERALLAAPRSPLAHLACALALEGKGQARSHLHEALAAGGHDALLVEQAATLYLRLGDLAAAASCAARALQLAPESAAAQVVLGGVARARGDRAAALDYADAALEGDPLRAEALVLRGWLQLDGGEVASARDHALWAMGDHEPSEAALTLLAAVKTRQWFLMGVAFRMARRTGHGDRTGGAALLVGCGATLPVVAAAAAAGGQPVPLAFAGFAGFAWLALCAYLWTAPRRFRSTLNRDARTARLRPDF